MAEFMVDKSPSTWLRVLYYTWIRYFGPMRTIVSDQEGAVISEMTATACERYNIRRELAGSEGHTGASLAERHIDLIRLAALKVWEEVKQPACKSLKIKLFRRFVWSKTTHSITEV